jgi:predicted PurR-regulated permease PerM
VRDAPEPRTELHVPTSTILKLLATAVLVRVGLRLWPQIVLLLVSVILSIALEPAVTWLNRRGLPRSASVAILAVLMIVALTLVGGYIVPPLIDQVGDFLRQLPELLEHVRQGLSPRDTLLRGGLDHLLHMPASAAFGTQVGSLLVWGQATVSGVATVALVLIVSLYLILDGRRMYAWLLAYVPVQHRAKMAATVPEVSAVIRAYVRGQVVTSLLFGLFAAALLAALDVPAAVPLALMAALCDVLPVIGIIIATVPAALLALSVSPLAAAVVAAGYIIYHQFETYYIAPRVYGSRLRMSALTVLLALIVGATLQGLLGAALILPIVAAYPTIERIWLKSYLGPRVISDHKALAHAMSSGDEQAIEDVLRAEKHGEQPH